MLSPGSSQLPLAAYSSSGPSPSDLQLLPITLSALVNAVMVTMALSSGRKLFRVGRWWRAAGTAVGVREQAQAPLPLLMFAWCMTLVTGLLRPPLHPGALRQSQRWRGWPPTEGNFLLSLLSHLLPWGNFLILRKMCFPFNKVHGYASTMLIRPLWFRKAKRITLAPGASVHLADTRRESPHAAQTATVSFYPGCSGWGDMLRPVQNCQLSI